MVMPVEDRSMLRKFPAIEKLSAHLPSIVAGPTNGSAPEHPIASTVTNHTNHTDLTERIGTSCEGFGRHFNLPR
jgi:hypothetical protein